MSIFNHNNPNSSAEVNKNTNKEIRRLLRKGETIGTGRYIGQCTLQYGKIRDIELVITVSGNGRIVKVEEF